MEEIPLHGNRKGPVGEALVFGTKRAPNEIRNAITEYVQEKYDPVDDWVSVDNKRTEVYRLLTEDGATNTTIPDGAFVAKWIPPENKDDVEYPQDRTMDGPDHRSRNELADEKAVFPVEVKTGEYAELERKQKEVLQSVSEADTQTHPVVVDVRLGGLPDSFSVDVTFL